MALRGKQAKVFAKVGSTWWPFSGLGTLEQADSSVGGADTTETFDDVITNPGTSTVGAFTLTCDFFSNDDLYRWLLAREQAGSQVELEVVLGGLDVAARYQSPASGGAQVAIAASGELTFAPKTGIENLLNGEGFKRVNPVFSGDILLVNAAAGAEFLATNASVFSIGTLGGGTVKPKVYNFDTAGAARISTPITARGFALLPPRQKAAFSAPVTSSGGMSVTGQTSPATRTLTFQPTVPVQLEPLGVIGAYAPS